MLTITLRPKGAVDSSTDVVLSTGSSRLLEAVGPSNASMSTSISVQEVRAIEAAAARYISRKNRSGSYQFNASRIFASVVDAGHYILTHGTTCPVEGTLIFQWSQSPIIVAMLGCCLRQIGEMKQLGVHVSCSYSVAFSEARTSYFFLLQPLIDSFYDRTEFSTNQPSVKEWARVNCGGAAIGTWERDYGWVGNPAIEATTDLITGFGAVPQEVYFYCRTENPLYEITFPAGKYDVDLHFAELLATAAGQRVMDVSINGVVALEDLDVFDEAGGRFKALVKTFQGYVLPATAKLPILVQGTTGEGFLNGIEVRPSATRKINCGGTATGSWEADLHYTGGSTASTANAITNAGDVPEAVYQVGRYDNHSYSVPLPNGTYTVKLHFAERFYTAANQRKFNVAIEGANVLSNLDVYAEAGARFKALVKTLANVNVTDGQLSIAFTGVVNNAFCCGIEIDPVGG